jgi:16S rRNA G966 N2-methylase RsmD
MKGLQVVKSDAYTYLQGLNRTFDIIFADPPYMSPETADVHQIVFERNLLNKGGFLIIEHGNDEKFNHLQYLKDKREIGNVNFTIFNA